MPAASNASVTRQRLFIAIPCPLTPPLKTAHDELRAAMRVPDSGVRVVDPDTLHLTLKFLGAAAETQQAVLRTTLAQLLQDQQAFTLRLTGAGSFHGALWLGVTPEPQLDSLASKLNAGLEALGFAPESKPFQPHVTLARLNRNPQFDWKSWLQQQRQRDWGSLAVNRVQLYRSETHPDGARYSLMDSMLLR